MLLYGGICYLTHVGTLISGASCVNILYFPEEEKPRRWSPKGEMKIFGAGRVQCGARAGQAHLEPPVSRLRRCLGLSIPGEGPPSSSLFSSKQKMRKEPLGVYLFPFRVHSQQRNFTDPQGAIPYGAFSPRHTVTFLN